MSDHIPQTPEALNGLWSWLSPIVTAIFGGGVVWATAQAKSADHERRLEKLESVVPVSVAELRNEMRDGYDVLRQESRDNHEQLVGLIVGLAKDRHQG